HFIILWDATNGVEISRTLVKDQSRSDVGRAYPSIYDANNSGFGLTTAVNDSNNNRILQVVSRYSDSSDGEGNKTDYWYANKLINGHVPYIALGAENINQYAWGAPDGCEPAALLEGLHLKGYATNLNYAQFLAQMPISNGNPYTGFGGSAYNGSGFPAIAPGALANWGRNYGNVTDISGRSVDQIKDQILNGNPVVAYVSIHFVNTYAINYWFGSMAYQNHAVLVDGYNDNAGTIHVSDPIDGSYWLSQSTFSNVYNVMKRAVVIA
uniref:C39 family peptidase n=1 Tax=Paucilactobacillus nenjiangensis TaxID=1296540 RepID=UPI003FA2D016